MNTISVTCCVPAESVCVQPEEKTTITIYPFCLNSKDMISYEFLQLDLIENTRKWTGGTILYPCWKIGDGKLDSVLRDTSPGHPLLSILHSCY